MLNKVCYCSITSDYISDNILRCDSKHTVQMRARLSAISNFTTLQLLTILQNWTTNTSEIIVDGEMLIVTSISFMLNDTTSVLATTTPTQIPINESITKLNVFLYSAVGFVGTSFFFLCISCIIISVGVLKSKRSHKIIPKLVVYVINYIDNDISITEDLKCKEEMTKIMIIAIRQQKRMFTMNRTY